MPKKRTQSLNRAAVRGARKWIRGGVAVGLVAGACGDGHGSSGDRTGSDGDKSAVEDGGAGIGAMRSPPPGMNAPTEVGGFAGIGGNPNGPIVKTTMMSDHLNVLYSWTTDKQIDKLRAKPVLLTRSETSNGVHTNLSVVLDALADTGNPLAAVLTGGAFQKGRHAWPFAWATLRGWPGESNGKRLLRIELKRESWIAVLNQGTLAVADLQGNPIALGAALGTPERIAAVYFMNRGDGTATCESFAGAPCANGTYREYFVNNEKMVQRWSFQTQEVLDELHRGINFIQVMRERQQGGLLATPADNCAFSAEAVCAWESGSSSAPGLQEYMWGLALTSEFYLPTLENLDALQDALKDALFEPDPFEHET